MKIELNLPNTDVVAWWGAVTATFVLLWDVYKWKTSGPKIRFCAKPNMKTVNIPSREGKTWISATAENIGTGATTITHLCFQYYRNYFKKLIKKPDSSFVVGGAEATPNQSIPYVLNPGTIWQGLALQTDELKKMSREGYLICELYYSQSRKPKERRVIIKEKQLKTQSSGR